MIQDILKYYIFEYEREVYGTYTPLTSKMIYDKMQHFYYLLKYHTDSKYNISLFMAVFFDKNNIGGRYYVNEDVPCGSVIDFSKLDEIELTVTENEIALLIPYCLYNNDTIKDIFAHKAIDAYNDYLALIERNVEFIFNEPIDVHSCEDWKQKFDDKLRIFKQKHDHDEIYQKLFCIFKLDKSNAGIIQAHKKRLSDAFAMTIKEWGLDLLRGEIFKHSTRSAVAAIMGRNMSHNIGSHVLARYSNAAGRAGEQRYVAQEVWDEIETKTGVELEKVVAENIVKGAEDHRAILLRYLQRRMDFIAEVATSDKSFWMQSLNLREVLSSLNYDNELDHINPDIKDRVKNHIYKPILLSYITGKEGMNATVEFDPGFLVSDPYFACPGGEVGAHALYIILENIIRNSARHNTDTRNSLPSNKVTLIVKADEAGEGAEDLWCITIIDCQSGIDKLDDINSTIRDEKILNSDGSPNPKGWGIREMQICAQYLRQFPMTDLQGTVDEPPVIKAFSYQHYGKDCLAYRIYLHRAKFCAFLPAPDTNCNTEELNKILRPKGIIVQCAPPEPSQLQGYNYVIVENYNNNQITSKEGNNTIIPLLHLPVRTMFVDHAFMKEQLDELLERTDKCLDSINPEAIVEKLHERLWGYYRDKRLEWKGKDIRSLVAWDSGKALSGIVDSGQCPPQSFCHTRVSDGNSNKPDGKPGDSDSPFKTFGKEIKYNQLGCAWIDHASALRFGQNTNPNLRSAGFEVSSIFSQPFVSAEFTDSLSPHLPLLEKQANGLIAGHELVAAALARVIVLDERVQNEINRRYRNVEYKVLWPCMGVWVPEVSDQAGAPPATDLNKPDFDEIKEFLKEPARKKGQYPPDFFVLHLTILENLKSQKGHNCEADTLAELLKGTSITSDCNIVIVTGRGVPSLSRHNSDSKQLHVRYLPISALLEYLLARPSKLALMRALWSAAAAFNEEGK